MLISEKNPFKEKENINIRLIFDQNKIMVLCMSNNYFKYKRKKKVIKKKLKKRHVEGEFSTILPGFKTFPESVE